MQRKSESVSMCGNLYRIVGKRFRISGIYLPFRKNSCCKKYWSMFVPVQELDCENVSLCKIIRSQLFVALMILQLLRYSPLRNLWWHNVCRHFSTQRISRHVDITFNISTKEQWKIKCNNHVRSDMQLLLNKRMKHHWVQNAALSNWEPYFVVYFQITLVSQRHSPVLVKKHEFYVNELSIGPACLHNWLQFSPLTKWTFLLHTRSGNPVRTPKSWDFPDFRIEF